MRMLDAAVEVVGLVAVAAGLGWAAGWWWAPLAPLVGGLVLISGVQLAHRLERS